MATAAGNARKHTTRAVRPGHESMENCDHLRLRDVCAALRLVGECRELARDPRAWRLHMLDGLRSLTGAQVALHLHLQSAGADTDRITMALDSGFLGTGQRALWAHYQQENAHRDDPFHQQFYAGFTGALRTRSLKSVVDPSEWQRSRHYNDYIRACKLQDRITSSFSLPDAKPSSIQVVVLHRASNDGPYAERSVHLVRLFQRELRPLIGRNLSVLSPEAELDTLPSQLRRVLGCLMQGDSEKQVADRLGISRHTVNRHVQRLHRRFGVQSRGELMFRCRSMPGVADVQEPDQGVARGRRCASSHGTSSDSS